MELNTSGSLDEILSSIHFMKSGQIKIENSLNLSSQDRDFSTLMMMQNFVTYALDRDDWIMEYLEELNDHLEKKAKPSKIHLRVIDGGIT